MTVHGDELAGRSCGPCKGPHKVRKIEGDELSVLAREVPAWRIEGRKLVREWKFPDFMGGLRWVERVATLAEAENHHPDVLLAWGKVRLELSTHSLGGISENDFILAAKIDRLTRE